MKSNFLHRFQVILLIVLASPLCEVAAQGTKSLSLAESIRLGLANSKTLKAADSKIVASDASVSDARMKQLPDLKVSGTYMQLLQPNVNLKFPMGKPSEENPSNEESGLSALKVNNAMFGSLNASLPLFSGFRIKNSIASAQYLRKAAQFEREHDREAETMNLIEAYYNLYKLQSAVRLVQENLKMAHQRVADFSNMERNGLLARNDLLKAQLQESNMELALLEAQNNEKTANYHLDIMLGLAPGTQLELDSLALDESRTVESLQDLETQALQNRNDRLALLEREEAAHLGIEIAKGEKYPALALTGGYIAAYVPHVLTVTNAVNIGLGLSYNIASLYKTEPKIRQAKAQQQQLVYAEQQLNDGIRVALFKAYQDYTEALKKSEVYARAVEQARENYRITKNKYDNALALTTDLLDADVAQLQSEINYAYAKADIQVAYNLLYQTAGILGKKVGP
ncbi:TolC family protein [Ravibacter arvi]|uniref:TolC family protein n=1 Tax=Ravibacter arvi TaxID=2051041 RepID=A0ABP8M5G3_9BACT